MLVELREELVWEVLGGCWGQPKPGFRRWAGLWAPSQSPAHAPRLDLNQSLVAGASLALQQAFKIIRWSSQNPACHACPPARWPAPRSSAQTGGIAKGGAEASCL